MPSSRAFLASTVNSSKTIRSASPSYDAVTSGQLGLFDLNADTTALKCYQPYYT